jgi:DNA-binding beta-propeller fold protein YncE
MTRRSLGAGLAIVALGGCGGSGSGLVPAAEPAHSPALARAPAGRVVPIGHKPEGLAYDARTRLLAVGLTDPDALALVDGRTGKVEKRIALPGAARHLRMARAGGPVLVPAENTDQVVEVSLPSGRMRASRVGRQPHDAVRARGRIFVGNERGRSVSVVERGREIRVLDAPVGPGGLAATAGAKLVAVIGVRERALELYDPARLRPVAKVAVGIGPTHVAASGQRLFVVDTRGNALIEVDANPPRVHRRTHLAGAPYGIAYDVVRRRFWVTLTAENRVAELTDRRLLRTFPTVRQPNSVAVDPVGGRVFVASRSEGTLQILDPPPYRG